jgi:hypothetical protein
VGTEAGKIAVCWRNHIYMDTPTAGSGEFDLYITNAIIILLYIAGASLKSVKTIQSASVG